MCTIEISRVTSDLETEIFTRTTCAKTKMKFGRIAFYRKSQILAHLLMRECPINGLSIIYYFFDEIISL
jgi:hypothetical protein